MKLLKLLLLLFIYINIVKCKSKSTNITFLSIGDWGCNNYKGHQNALNVANIAAKVKISPMFIVSAGDNMYENGVTSSNSPLFKKLWFDVFLRHESLKKRWYMSLGNHDHRGSVRAQIKYSKKHPKYFYMPERYYDDVIYSPNGISLHLIILDSTAIVRAPDNDIKQLRWLKRRLKRISSITWRIVVAHHPMYSLGIHGNTPEMIRFVQPMLRKYGCDLFINGHDHDLQAFQSPDDSIEYLVSGGGCKSSYPVESLEQLRYGLKKDEATPKMLLASATNGFMTHTLTKEYIETLVHNDRGQIIHKNIHTKTYSYK